MLTIKYAKDPIWNDENHNSIHLTVKFEEMNEELPFTATPYDVMHYGVELFNNAKEGKYGEIAPYIPFTPTSE